MALEAGWSPDYMATGAPIPDVRVGSMKQKYEQTLRRISEINKVATESLKKVSGEDGGYI